MKERKKKIEMNELEKVTGGAEPLPSVVVNCFRTLH
jgi:hypothetical protein